MMSSRAREDIRSGTESPRGGAQGQNITARHAHGWACGAPMRDPIPDAALVSPPRKPEGEHTLIDTSHLGMHMTVSESDESDCDESDS